MADDLEAFAAAVDAELTRQFGPDHQKILGASGRLISYFDWNTGEIVTLEQIPAG